jgi:hypothetical protein
MPVVSHDHMVQHLDLEKLPGTYQVPGNFDVRFRRTRVAARMVVLCEAPSYVECPVGKAGIGSAFTGKGMPWIRVTHPRRASPTSRFAR